MRSRLSFPDCSSFNVALIPFTFYKMLDVNTGRDDLGRIEFTGLDQLLDLSNGHPASRRHHRIEVASRLPVHQVAVAVALPCFHQGEVRRESTFQQINAAIELACFLAIRDDSAHAGRRVEGWNARAASANAFC